MPAEIKDMLPDIFGKDLQQTGNLANFNEPRLNYISILDTVQDFLWELAIKPYTVRAPLYLTRGLYIFYPLFEGQKRFLRGFFHKILALCMVSIQERFLIKSGL